MKNYFFVLIIFIGSCSAPKTEKQQNKAKPEIDYKAELTGVNHYDTIQNFHFLISTKDTSASGLQKIARELKEKHCTIKCNIDLYDDQKSYRLAVEKDSIDILWNVQLSQNEITLKEYKNNFDKWNNKNYCYMANHHLGRYSYDNYFWPYRLVKESTYKELCK